MTEKTEADKMRELRKLFPDWAFSDLKDALSSSNGNLEEAKKKMSNKRRGFLRLQQKCVNYGFSDRFKK